MNEGFQLLELKAAGVIGTNKRPQVSVPGAAKQLARQ